MVDADFGFDIYRGEVSVMAAAHRHQELELNLIFEGAMTYLFGGSTFALSKGQVALFWATTPHRLIICEADTNFGWITLPLANFLRYGLPESLVLSVLQSKPVTATFSDLDRMLFNRWLEDAQHTDAQHTDAQHIDEASQTILELELEALLRRVARKKTDLEVKQRPVTHSKSAQIAQYISEHYQEPLSLETIATAVALNPSYAATLFKASFGMTIHAYLNQYRVAHAQRLLVTTDMPILELAFDAGFGSSSQFYAAFAKACAKTPGAYRRTLR